MNKYRLLKELLKGSNVSQIARNLGKSRLTIYSWLKKYDDVSETYRKTMNKKLNGEAQRVSQEQRLMNSLSNIAKNTTAKTATIQQRLSAPKQLFELYQIRKKFIK